MHTMHIRALRTVALAFAASLTMAACGGGNEGTDTSAAVGDAAGNAVASADTAAGNAAGAVRRWDFWGNDDPKSDAEIMTLVAHSNALEISSSQLAEQKATNPQVKSFAQLMTKDHLAMQKEGAKLGTALGVKPASTDATQDLREEMKDDVEGLRNKTGADFDKEYMELQVEAHRQTLERLQRLQGTAQNADLKAMITKAIPKVQAHLQQAETIHKSLEQQG